MSSINLKIDENRDVIQSYYNGKWNDLSNKNIDPKLYYTHVKGLYGDKVLVESTIKSLITPDGYLDGSKLLIPDSFNTFPINHYNGIVIENFISYAITIAVHTNTLRLIPNVPKEIFNTGVLYNHSGSVIAKRAYNDGSYMVSIFGELPGFTSRVIETSTELSAITLPIRGKNVFTDNPYISTTVTIINVMFLPE